jgi:hypothetical protein
MAYTLKLSPNGQYILDTQDVFNTTYTQKINPNEFEAYTGQKATTPVNQPLVGTTSLAEQTQKVMRETPGQYQTVTDPVTGETKTVTKGQAITEIKDTISTLPTPTTGTAARETSLDKVQRILSSTPSPAGSGFNMDEYFNKMESIQKQAQKAQLVNKLVGTGLDIGVDYLRRSYGGFSTGGYTGPISTPLYGGSYAAGGGYVPVGYDAAGEFGSSAGGFSPGAGAGLAAATTFLQTGDVGQAAKTGAGAYVGGTIGTAVGGPIGGAIGSTIGAAVGGRVICSELYRQKLLNKEDYLLDLEFTKSHLTNIHVKGYWHFAVPAVKKMRQSKLHTKFWHHIASNRIKDIKWRLGKGKFNLLGRIYSFIFEPFCYMSGLLVNKITDYNKELYN